MVIINTGGTFNKRYDPIKGELFVPEDDTAVEAVLRTFAETLAITGIIYKDSLEMNDEDRSLLCDRIAAEKADRIVVVHGTDTMDQSAAAIASLRLDKTVVFTGAMVPFFVDPLEATANLAMAIGYAQNAQKGVYIVMQGISGTYERVRKNKEAGKFEHV